MYVRALSLLCISLGSLLCVQQITLVGYLPLYSFVERQVESSHEERTHSKTETFTRYYTLTLLPMLLHGLRYIVRMYFSLFGFRFSDPISCDSDCSLW